jgi:hypothetical protein
MATAAVPVKMVSISEEAIHGNSCSVSYNSFYPTGGPTGPKWQQLQCQLQ